MGRGYRFWVRYLWQTISVGVAAAVVMFLLTGVGVSWSQVAGTLAGLPYYLVLGSSLALTLICFATHLVYFPLVLALGSTRREAFWGFLLYRLGAVVITALLSLAILLPLAAGETWQVFPVLVLVLLFGCTLGSLMGLAYQKLKFIGILMLMVIFAIVGGFVSFFLVGGNAAEEIFDGLFAALGRYVVVGGILWLLSAVLDLSLTSLALRHREVKL